MPDNNKLPPEKRSEFVETASWADIAHIQWAEQNAHDLKIINARAETLNREASDVLEYQALP